VVVGSNPAAPTIPDQTRLMTERAGTYAGCVWLFIAAWLAIGAYLALGIAGPSAPPAVLGIVIVAILGVVFAVALWTGRGGRRVAAASAIIGLILGGLNIVLTFGSDHSPTGIGTPWKSARGQAKRQSCPARRTSVNAS
jgi:hypothetical protein